MRVTIRTIGNSKGVVLPMRVLVQAGLEDALDAEKTVEAGAIILRNIAKPTRVGWAEAAQAIADKGGEKLMMGEFANEGDTDLAW